MVYSTIDDVIDGLGIGDMVSRVEGLTPAQAREVELEYARAVSWYDETRGGFRVYRDFIPDDSTVFDSAVYQRQVDVLEDAVNRALLAV